MKKKPLPSNHTRESWREHRRRRFRRHGRRAYIRSAYSLPTLATLGNAICGFGAVYVAGLDPATAGAGSLAPVFSFSPFTAGAFFIFFVVGVGSPGGGFGRVSRRYAGFWGQAPKPG